MTGYDDNIRRAGDAFDGITAAQRRADRIFAANRAAVEEHAAMPAPGGWPIDFRPFRPAEIPGCTAPIPDRVKSFEIPGLRDAEIIAASDYISPVEEMIRKVAAEDARMRRMLPPAPDGMAWTSELQRLEDRRGFAGDYSDRLTFRIVYRLVSIR